MHFICLLICIDSSEMSGCINKSTAFVLPLGVSHTNDLHNPEQGTGAGKVHLHPPHGLFPATCIDLDAVSAPSLVPWPAVIAPDRAVAMAGPR